MAHWDNFGAPRGGAPSNGVGLRRKPSNFVLCGYAPTASVIWVREKPVHGNARRTRCAVGPPSPARSSPQFEFEFEFKFKTESLAVVAVALCRRVPMRSETNPGSTRRAAALVAPLRERGFPVPFGHSRAPIRPSHCTARQTRAVLTERARPYHVGKQHSQNGKRAKPGERGCGSSAGGACGSSGNDTRTRSDHCRRGTW